MPGAGTLPALGGRGLRPELASTGLGPCPEFPTLSSRCEKGFQEGVSLAGGRKGNE